LQQLDETKECGANKEDTFAKKLILMEFEEANRIAQEEDKKPLTLSQYLHSLDAQQCATKLRQCLDYLRSHHFYCLFCGTKYETEDEMRRHCPGPSEDVHDLL